MKIVPQEPDNGAVIVLNSRAIYLTWKQLYELSVGLKAVELCHECYRPVEVESSMGNGYHPGCFQNMMDRLSTAGESQQTASHCPEFRPLRP